jgi:putative SOS response-associated peptidase YedK
MICGRFAQTLTRDAYLSHLQDERTQGIAYDPHPINRYNTAPGTRVLLLNERDGQLSLDPVLWGYAPEWWTKPALINARAETAPTSPMFRSLWRGGRGVIFADGWYEWKKESGGKQPCYISRKDDEPLFFAAIGSPPFDRGSENEGFMILTAAAEGALSEIHDRRPVTLPASSVATWLDAALTPDGAVDIVNTEMLPSSNFHWYPVSKAVGNVQNQGPELNQPLR